MNAEKLIKLLKKVSPATEIRQISIVVENGEEELHITLGPSEKGRPGNLEWKPATSH